MAVLRAPRGESTEGSRRPSPCILNPFTWRPSRRSTNSRIGNDTDKHVPPPSATAPSPSTESVLFLLVGLGVAEVILSSSLFVEEHVVQMTTFTLQLVILLRSKSKMQVFFHIDRFVGSIAFGFKTRNLCVLDHIFDQRTSGETNERLLLLTGTPRFGLKPTGLGKAWLR